MKEWGLIAHYWQYKQLPERVVTLWRIAANAEAVGTQTDTTKPTQDLLAGEAENEAASW